MNGILWAVNSISWYDGTCKLSVWLCQIAKHNFIVQNKKIGDYFIPNLELPEDNRSIGKYGRMHGDHLKKHCSIRYNDLILRDSCGRTWLI